MTQCQTNLILLALGQAWMNILSIFSRKMQPQIIHMHAETQSTNKNKGKLVLKYNIHQRQHMATSTSQALDNWSEIFYACWY